MTRRADLSRHRRGRRQAVLRPPHRVSGEHHHSRQGDPARDRARRGQVYNSRLWEFSLLRLNQLGYFEQLKPDDPNATDRKLDEKEGLVDLTLKVKEKGKNSIGLNGGVSGLEGAFVGLSYTTNNFLGLGETLQIQASIGNLCASVLGFRFSPSLISGIGRCRPDSPSIPRGQVITRRSSMRSSPDSN